MNVPKKDLEYSLPIRWAFHMWVTRGRPGGRWDNFWEWREYLLSWEETGIDLLYEWLKHDDFELEVRPMLRDLRADTLAGFIRFYVKSLGLYKSILNGADPYEVSCLYPE